MLYRVESVTFYWPNFRGFCDVSFNNMHAHKSYMDVFFFLQMYLDYVITYAACSKKMSDTCKIKTLMANTPTLAIPPFEKGSYVTIPCLY